MSRRQRRPVASPTSSRNSFAFTLRVYASDPRDDAAVAETFLTLAAEAEFVNRGLSSVFERFDLEKMESGRWLLKRRDDRTT